MFGVNMSNKNDCKLANVLQEAHEKVFEQLREEI